MFITINVGERWLLTSEEVFDFKVRTDKFFKHSAGAKLDESGFPIPFKDMINLKVKRYWGKLALNFDSSIQRGFADFGELAEQIHEWTKNNMIADLNKHRGGIAIEVGCCKEEFVKVTKSTMIV